MSRETERSELIRAWIAVLGASLAAFMAILDVAISNASMKNIQASLATSVDETSWISTAYIIAETVTIPLTGWLMSVFSIRRYLLISTVLFVAFSILCGLANSLPQMIAARSLQGLAGGALIPCVATLIIVSIPRAQHMAAFGVLSLAIAFAPSIGPALGGWITSVYGWRFSYYINIIPGLLSAATMIWCLKPSRPKLNLLREGDWWGISSMVVGLGTLIYILEEGYLKDWFEDGSIRTLSIVCALCLSLFVLIEWNSSKPFVHLKLLQRRNFLLANVASFFLGVIVFGNVYVGPRYLQQMQGYDAFQSGQTMMWMGIPQLFLIPLLPIFLKRIKPKFLVSGGFLLFAYANHINSLLTNSTGGDQLILPQVIRSVGVAMISTPLTLLAMSDFEGVAVDAGSASALFNMMRNLGGSFCIGLTSTFLDHRYKLHFARLGESLNWSNDSLKCLTGMLTCASRNDLTPVIQTLNQESQIMAFADWYAVTAWIILIAAVIVLAITTKGTLKTQIGPGH